MGSVYESLVRLSKCDSPMETVEYVWRNIWCMLNWILSQNCRNTLTLHTVDQLVRSTNNEMLLYLSEEGFKHRLHGLLPKTLESLSQFYKIQTGGWPSEVLHEIKRRTIRKWELNTCDNFLNFRTEDFFVGRCRSKISTM